MTHILWARLKQNESKRKEKIAYEMPYKHCVPFELYSDNQYQWVTILQMMIFSEAILNRNVRISTPGIYVY